MKAAIENAITHLDAARASMVAAQGELTRCYVEGREDLGQILLLFNRLTSKTGALLSLRSMLETRQSPIIAQAIAPSSLENDVISALVNMGSRAPAAAAAVDAALKNGAAHEFNDLFRKSVALLSQSVALLSR